MTQKMIDSKEAEAAVDAALQEEEQEQAAATAAAAAAAQDEKQEEPAAAAAAADGAAAAGSCSVHSVHGKALRCLPGAAALTVRLLLPQDLAAAACGNGNEDGGPGQLVLQQLQEGAQVRLAVGWRECVWVCLLCGSLVA
jgi:hypothetical protein